MAGYWAHSSDGYNGWWQRGRGNRKKSKPYTVCGACSVGWTYKPVGKKCWHCGLPYGDAPGGDQAADKHEAAMPQGALELYKSCGDDDFRNTLVANFPALAADKETETAGAQPPLPTVNAANRALNNAEFQLNRAALHVTHLEGALKKAKEKVIDKLLEVKNAKKILEAATAHRAGGPQPEGATKAEGAHTAPEEIVIKEGWSEDLADKARRCNELAEQARRQRQEFEDEIAETISEIHFQQGGLDDSFQDAGAFQDVREQGAAEGEEPTAENDMEQDHDQDLDRENRAGQCKRVVQQAEAALAKRIRVVGKKPPLG